MISQSSKVYAAPHPAAVDVTTRVLNSFLAFAPSNVTDSLGRSLLLGGAALLVARVLDEAAGRNGK